MGLAGLIGLSMILAPLAVAEGSSRDAASRAQTSTALALFQRDWVLMNWALRFFDADGDIALSPDGAHLAWFAGFLPSVAPKYVVTVMLQGRSGGADAAPVAGRILEAAWGGRW